MRAAIYERYGGPEVVQIREVAKPVPKDNEVLVRVKATTVTTGDWRSRSLKMPAGLGIVGRLMFGITKPRQPILGTELAGMVESVGSAVTTFRLGDEVVAFPGTKLGAHAEYRVMPADGMIARKPKNLSFAEAAGLFFGGTTALDFFRRGKLKSGESILIIGAAGGVGSAAVQLAKHLGAVVTGVCGPANLELVRSLGADAVVDYTKEDVLQNGQTYDLIMDIAGTAPFAKARASLMEGGRMLVVMGGLGDMLGSPFTSKAGGKTVIAGPAAERREDLLELVRLAEAGAYKPVIDSTFPFERIVEAHARVDTGHKRGSVVVTLE